MSTCFSFTMLFRSRPLSPSGAMTMCVSNEKANSSTVIDGETREVSATGDVGNRPRGIALSEDNSLLYICVGDDDHIGVLDTESLEVVDTLPSGPDPELLVISPDGNRLYVEIGRASCRERVCQYV